MNSSITLCRSPPFSANDMTMMEGTIKNIKIVRSILSHSISLLLTKLSARVVNIFLFPIQYVYVEWNVCDRRTYHKLQSGVKTPMHAPTRCKPTSLITENNMFRISHSLCVHTNLKTQLFLSKTKKLMRYTYSVWISNMIDMSYHIDKNIT